MARLVHAILVGLVGAGIVHIAILLLMPAVSTRDAWSRLSAAGKTYAFIRTDGRTAGGTGGLGKAAASIDPIDPAIDTAACRFDLARGAVHVAAHGRVPFWSASVYNRGGQNIYSLNDRAATGGALDLVIVTPAQMIEVRKAIPPEFAKSVFVEADVGEGIVVVRAFVPDRTWAPAISAFLGDATCQSL